MPVSDIFLFLFFCVVSLQTENAEVEFEVEQEEETGKYKAINVTAPGGGPLTPPPRGSRGPKQRRSTAEGGGGESGEGQDNANGGTAEGNKSPRKPKVPPFHADLDDDVKEKIVETAGIELGPTKTTVDVAQGGARIKLGQGGYCAYCNTDALVGEGTYTCDSRGVVTFAWERSLEFVDGKWVEGETSKLPQTLTLTDGKCILFLLCFAMIFRI